jgi:hypothetical protein
MNVKMKHQLTADGREEGEADPVGFSLGACYKWFQVKHRA